MSYQVVAPLVYLKVPGLAGMFGTHVRAGYVGLMFYRGAIVPADAHPESLQRLLAEGLVVDLEPPSAGKEAKTA